MRYLSIDFGLKRIGLAVADSQNAIAFPLSTLQRTTRAEMFASLQDILSREKIEKIIIGLPLDLDGSETLTTRQVKNFAQSLGRRTDLPIYFENEALTSFEAEEKLRQAGLKGKKLKQKLDQMAAVEILQSYLHKAVSIQQ